MYAPHYFEPSVGHHPGRPKGRNWMQALKHRPLSFLLFLSSCLPLRLRILLTKSHILCIWSKWYQNRLEGRSNEHLP